MSIQYGAIKVWPGKLRAKGERIKAPFKSGHTETLRVLDRELRMIGAEGVVVQLAMEHFNRNGLPYADATPTHPGVIVSFRKPVRRPTGELIKVPLRFAADRFTTWETNLRAVAIGLEDLRRIDRYGITTGSEQYLGFKALPPPGPEHQAIGTVEEAAAFVAKIADFPNPGMLIGGESFWRNAYRAAAAKLHPDANPGEGGLGQTASGKDVA